MYVPEAAAVGVPVIVTVLLLKPAISPGGKSVEAPIPVNPDVECVIGFNAVPTQIVGVDEAAPIVPPAIVNDFVADDTQPDPTVKTTVTVPGFVAESSPVLEIVAAPV